MKDLSHSTKSSKLFFGGFFCFFVIFKLLSLSIPNDGKARVKNTKRALTSFESILKMFPYHEFDMFSVLQSI